MKKQVILSGLLALLMLAAPLSGCSKTVSAGGGEMGGSASSGAGGWQGRQGSASGGDSSRTQTVGKVTSVIGNQVVLAVGTMGQGSSGGASSGTSSEAPESSASSQGQGSASSGSFTPTGESKTFLIPVGLSLTEGVTRSASGFGGTAPQSGASGAAAGGSAARSAGSRSGSFGGGSARTGGTAAAGGTTRASAGTASRSTAGGTTSRTRDFSTITVGMVLRVTEEKQSDGSMRITQVAVLSR